MKKLEYITILRSLAILSVLVVHIKQVTNATDYLHPLLLSIMDNGARGVELFYVLSAFTLFISFNKRNIEKTPIKNYFIRRFFRIAPLFYLAIIYYLWQDGLGSRYWLGDSPQITLPNIVSNFLFLQSFNPYWIASIVPGGWSVAIEVIFYCGLPFLFLKIKNIQQALYFTLICLVFRFVLYMIFQRFNPISDARLWHEYLFLYLPNQLPVFSLGIVLYFLIYDKNNFSISPKFCLLGSIILIFGLCINQEQVLSEIFYFSLSFILLALGLRKYHPSIFFNPVLIYIGNISYTIYLTHWAVIHLVKKYHLINLFAAKNEPGALINFLVNYLIILGITILFCTILYYSVELPMQKVGKRLIKKYS